MFGVVFCLKLRKRSCGYILSISSYYSNIGHEFYASATNVGLLATNSLVETAFSLIR